MFTAVATVTASSMETDQVEDMDVSESGGKAKPFADLNDAIKRILQHPNAHLSDDDDIKLVQSCTAFIRHPVDADTLHSSMRLLLRYEFKTDPMICCFKRFIFASTYSFYLLGC